VSNRNNRNNRYTAIPEVRDDLQSIATAVRALKQTVDVLSRQSGNEDDWAATVADLTTAVTTAANQATNNTDWSQLLNDPTIDVIFDRAAAKADRLAQDTRDEARIALAKLQTAFDNFRNGYVDDNAVIKASITQLEASVEENNARISSEELVRVTATQALAGRIDTVSAQTQGSLAAVTNEILALSGPTGAIATQINAVTTASTNAKTYIQSTQPQSLTTNAYWVDLNGATPVVKQWSGSTWTTRTATIAATAPSSPATNALWFDTTVSLLKLWNGSAWVTQAAFVQSRTPTTIAVGDLWLDTTQANALKRWNGTAWVTVANVDNLGVLLSTLVTESISKTDADRTTATRIDNLISLAPDGNSATINNTQITTATRTEALASDLTNLEVQTTGGSAGGFYRLLASASPADGALAEFQIQVRAAQSGANSTYSTAGMRIQAMSNGTSRVKFNTDQFIIANATDTYTPFAVTSGQLAVNALIAAANVNGQLTTSQIAGLGAFATLSKIPAASAATYIDNLAVSSALIANGAIVNAKIGDAEITSAKIANAAITNAKIGNAEITTLKIGANQVTVPVRYSFGSVAGSGSTFTGSFTLPDAANVLLVVSVALPNDNNYYVDDTGYGYTTVVYGVSSSATAFYPLSFSSRIQISIDGVGVFDETPPHMQGALSSVIASRSVASGGTKSFSITITPSTVNAGGYPSTGSCPRNVTAFILAAAR